MAPGAPTRYRARCIEIEAIPVQHALRLAAKDWRMLPAWLVEEYARHRLSFGTTGIRMKAIDGESVAAFGDWVVRGVEGEIYPVRASVFEASFEPAEEPSHG